MKTHLTVSPDPQIETLKIDCYKISSKGWAIEPASAKRSWMDQTGNHAYKCLPLSSANQMGWNILCPIDFSAIWEGNTSPAATKILIEDEESKGIALSHFGHGIITFQIPYLFKTSNDIGLFVRGSTNFWIEGAQALDGFVETYWSNYSFTMNWKIIRPNTLIHFKKGDPICMIIPYPVNLLENTKVSLKPLSENPEVEKSHRKWSNYRNEFNNKPDRGDDWQKDYFVGRKCPFSGNKEDNIADPHKVRFKLQRFDENA